MPDDFQYPNAQIHWVHWVLSICTLYGFGVKKNVVISPEIVSLGLVKFSCQQAEIFITPQKCCVVGQAGSVAVEMLTSQAGLLTLAPDCSFLLMQTLGRQW